MDGLTEVFTAPNTRVAEITLIGGTEGFGESIVIHLGDGYWAVVDCCVDPVSNKVLPLEYLRDMGVDVKEQLLYVICSHWHSDHILGLSKLLKECGNKTVFVLSCAEDRQTAVYEFVSDYDYSGQSTVLNELKHTLEIIRDKRIKIKRIEQDKLIFKKGAVCAFALSPSEVETRKFEREVASVHARFNHLVQDLKSRKKTPDVLIEAAEDIEKSFFEEVDKLIDDKLDVNGGNLNSIDELSKFKDANKIKKNDRSVAMLVSFGSHHVVLGADLEVSQIDSGWHSVLCCECMDDVEANLFKIPHHGSKTGYLKDFLDKYIKKDATAKLTSWVLGGNVLPSSEMLKKYFAHTSNLYITTTKLLKFKNSEENRCIRKIMNSKTESICEVIPQMGIIRSRIQIDSNCDEWTTHFYGSAEQLTDEKINSLA